MWQQSCESWVSRDLQLPAEDMGIGNPRQDKRLNLMWRIGEDAKPLIGKQARARLHQCDARRFNMFNDICFEASHERPKSLSGLVLPTICGIA